METSKNGDAMMRSLSPPANKALDLGNPLISVKHKKKKKNKKSKSQERRAEDAEMRSVSQNGSASKASSSDQAKDQWISDDEEREPKI